MSLAIDEGSNRRTALHGVSGMIASIGRASPMKLVPWLKSHARRGSVSSHCRYKETFKIGTIPKTKTTLKKIVQFSVDIPEYR